MKQFLLIFLSCLLLVPSIGEFFVYASFKINQNEISKTICVQRKMVVNTCNGRCELQKSLKKYDTNEKKMDHNLKDKADFVYLPTSSIPSCNTIHYSLEKATNYASHDKKTISVTVSTFRPPSYFI